MKGEIRDLNAGIYINEDADMFLDIYRDDNGIHIVQVDLDLDIVSHWVIGPKGEVINHSLECLDMHEGIE
jgi:hypothetical protein